MRPQKEDENRLRTAETFRSQMLRCSLLISHWVLCVESAVSSIQLFYIDVNRLTIVTFILC